LAAARALAQHPRIDVTGLESVIKTRYTYDTIVWLKARCPGVRFVWIMGADNLRSFHRWQRWRGIAKLVPFVVIDRLGPSLYAGVSPAGQALRQARIPEHDAPCLPDRKPPAWTFLHGLKSALSSTALRALRKGSGGTQPAGKRKISKRKTAKSAKRKAPKKNQRKAGKTTRRKGGKKRL
jgi:nicotinate-nucleotide adenylyltransferase